MEAELKSQLDRIFYPRGVAVVGASPKPGNFGMRFLQGVVNGGHPRVYPVHPELKELLGLTVYPSVLDIPGEVDLVIVAAPARTVPQVVSECVRKGVAGVHIYTAGFGEAGEAGQRLQEEMVRMARTHGTRLIGPNCMGVGSPRGRVGSTVGMPGSAGTVGLVSQSGYLFAMTIRLATEHGVRFNKMVSYGNACDLGAADFFQYFGSDPEIKLIAAYLEGVPDGRQLLEAVRGVTSHKPVLVLKGGMTGPGVRAALSHTTSLAGSDAIWRAFFRQTGVVAAESLEELVDLVIAFNYVGLPRGRKVAILSGGGGLAVSCADVCTRAGLEVVPFSARTRSRLAQVQAIAGSGTGNPVDLGMMALNMPHIYADSVRVIAQNETVDMFLVVGTSEAKLEETLVPALKETGKPAVMVFVAPSNALEPAFWQAGIPIYRDVRRAANALAKLRQYAEFLEQRSG